MTGDARATTGPTGDDLPSGRSGPEVATGRATVAGPEVTTGPDVTTATGPELRRLPPPDPVYGTPTAPELLTAVGDFLRSEVLDGTTGHTRYLLWVAISVVDIVRRQCEQGDDARRDLGTSLAALGMADEAALARAVRAGDFDERSGELRRYLQAAVTRRLAVANPRYLAEAGAAPEGGAAPEATTGPTVEPSAEPTVGPTVEPSAHPSAHPVTGRPAAGPVTGRRPEE